MADQLSILVKKAKKGDGEAFVKAIKLYEGVLYGVAKRLLDCDEDIADAMQEAIMKAFENINTLQNEQYFKTWVCKILINKCNEILRKNKKLICVDEVLPNKVSGNEFLRIELNDAINSLNHDYKLVVILYYIVGLNTREIGNFLKEPEGTVKSRLSRARATLKKKYYSEEGCSEYGKKL
ncbi:sigma-70 family RNA polymerase sigma factor [Candidatus Contubernalis alkalaceticus]|nr:sigma-70 family RNA polymerase sigma factor [Candidatus Contubernalis alkalaceticus]